VHKRFFIAIHGIVERLAVRFQLTTAVQHARLSSYIICTSKITGTVVRNSP